MREYLVGLQREGLQRTILLSHRLRDLLGHVRAHHLVDVVLNPGFLAAAMTQQLGELKSRNELARQGNERLAAEVRDLREGMEMVEEKARFELGMVRPNEILVQIAK